MRGHTGPAVIMLALTVLPACHIVFGFDGELPPSEAGPDTPPDGDVGPYPCSTIHIIGNDFTDGDYARSFGGGSNGVSVVNGELTLTNSPGQLITLDTGHFYNADGQPITFRFGDTGIDEDNTAHIIITGELPDHQVVITRTGDQLEFSVAAGDGLAPFRSFTYDAQLHAFVSVLFQDNQVLFATSSDGDVFDNAGGRILPEMQFVHVAVQTFRPADAGPLTFFIDDVMGGEPDGAACPSTDLNDRFAGPSLDRMWAADSFGATASLIANELVIDIQPGNVNSTTYSLIARRPYNFVNSELLFEIPQMVSDAEVDFRFFVSSRTQDLLRLIQAGGMIYAILEQADGTDITIFDGPYLASAMRWWRIRDADGLTFWEVSPNGMTWTSLGQFPGVLGLDVASAVVQVRSTSDQPDQARIANVNIAP